MRILRPLSHSRRVVIREIEFESTKKISQLADLENML